MGIKGLTVKNDWTDRDILGRIEITVFKGARKGERRAGENLGDKFRIVCSDERLRKILAQFYGKPDQNGDILTDALNVIFPFDEPDRTFETSMKSYSASGLQVVCDRAVISQETVQEQDEKGNVFTPIRACNKPCPVADKPIGFQCPKGCAATGILYFYIKELFLVNRMVPCKITCHAYSDITYISSRLEGLRQELASITSAAFPCVHTMHKVPFVMTKTQIDIKRPVVASKQEGYKRTGKKANGSTWAVTINPDPEYIQLLQAWKLAEEMRSRQIPLPSKTYAGLLGGDPTAVNYIDIEVVPNSTEQESVLSLMPSPISNEERRELFKIFLEENAWTKQAFQAMLNEEYGYTKTSEIISTQMDDLKQDALDTELRDRYIELTIKF